MEHMVSFERRFFYNLLSDIFILRPDVEFLERLHKDELYEFLLDYFDGDKKEIKNLRDLIGAAINHKDKLIELQDYFESTFVVPVAVYYIPPMMSAFVNYRNLRNNNNFYTLVEELSAVYSFYNLNFNTRSDHISIIFSFMSFLINLELEDKNNSESTIKPQKEFFSKYINTWVENFLKEIILRSNNLFYTCFAKLTSEFLKKEQKFFEE